MITKQQVLDAQRKWADGVIKIGSLKDSIAECEAFTSDFIDDCYHYEVGPVLFKPTKTTIVQFRHSKRDAVSYFIAGNDKSCEEDKGFAIQPWIKIKFENAAFILEESRAIAMGNYFFTDLDHNEAKVEYTFGYNLVGGALKIDLHHSSFPYNPNA